VSACRNSAGLTAAFASTTDGVTAIVNAGADLHVPFHANAARELLTPRVVAQITRDHVPALVWSMTVNGPMTHSGRVATLKEAKAQFQKSWEEWKAWAKLKAGLSRIDAARASRPPE
jgi:hypothetical protein